MRSRVVLAVAVVSVSAVLAPPTAAQSQRRAPVAAATDAVGDVAIRDVPGPSAAQRRSIDLLEAKAVSREGLIRFTFRIAEVTTSTEFDQLLTMTLVDAEPGPERTEGQVTLRVQHLRSGLVSGSVETESEGSGATCFTMPIAVARDRGLVKIDAYRGCLPPGAVSIRVKSFTTTPKGERRTVYSRDFLRIPGSVDLGGTVGDEPE